MRGVRHILMAASLAVAVACAGGAAQAAKFKVLAWFGSKLGTNPLAPVLIDQAGNLYTTASQGGAQLGGTAVELKRKAGGYKATPIFRFCGQCGRGAAPDGPLIIDTQGNLYGMANNLVFELSPVADQKTWAEKILYRFCSQQNCSDGNLPTKSGLTYAGAATGIPYDGTSPLYGTTQLGGSSAGGGGVVFELTPNGNQWAETVLYNFCSQGGSDCTDGQHPLGTPLLDQAGHLYGTALEGGNKFQPHGAGLVYELSRNGESWVETVLYRFCSLTECRDGARPIGSLAMDAAGSLFGVTENGGCKVIGDTGCGVLFKLEPKGEDFEETVLHAFCSRKDCLDGRLPQAGPLLDAFGNLFATTEWGGGNDIDQRGDGGGVVYELANGSLYKVLHSFCSLAACADGEYPQGELTISNSAELFGTTELGGASASGTLFKAPP